MTSNYNFLKKNSVGLVFSTPLKNMLVKLDHFPNFRGENKKYLSCHHLAVHHKSQTKTGIHSIWLFKIPPTSGAGTRGSRRTTVEWISYAKAYPPGN